MTTHTPGPWRVEANRSSVAVNAGNFCVAITATLASGVGAPAKGNAEFIVRACNAHDDLVAALRLAETWLLKMNRMPRPETPARETLGAIRAALAKAGQT